MGFFARLLPERRADLKSNQFWADALESWGWNYQPAKAGVAVNPSTVLSASSVFAAVRNISEDVGRLPVVVYRRLDNRDVEQDKHPLSWLMNYEPNFWANAIDVRSAITGQALLWGNGYAEVRYYANAKIASIEPLSSSRVTVKFEDRDLIYTHREEDGTDRRIAAANVFHLRGWGSNGLIGHMVTRLGKDSFGLLIAAEQLGASFFGNGIRPSGTLTVPGKIDKQHAEALKARWQAMCAGAGIAVVDAGAKFEKTSIDPEEAQFLETRQFQVEEVARWFRIPPHKLQHLLRATFSNIEHQSIEYVNDTLGPWTTRWEQEVKRKLISDSEPDLYVKHDPDTLLRGDMQSRYTAYGQAVNAGWLTRNEARELEAFNPLPGGDVPIVQGAMIAATALQTEPTPVNKPPPVAPATPPTEPEDDQDEEAERIAGLVASHADLLARAIESRLRVEASKVKALANAKDGRALDEFYAEHETYLRGTLGPVIDAAAAGLWMAMHRTKLPSIMAPALVGFVADVAKRHVADSRRTLADYANWAKGRAEVAAKAEIETLLDMLR